MPEYEQEAPCASVPVKVNGTDADTLKETNTARRLDASSAPVQLAVYDFDGTSITGNSPVLLVSYMARRRMLKLGVLVRILLWAFAYKMRLPQNESSVRSLVFTAFAGKPKEEVDCFLREFYDDRIAPRFRNDIDVSMRKHREQGHVVVIVSATFAPILERAKELHPFDYQISTLMHVDDCGNYTNEVEGLPVEGEEKPRAIEAFADKTFGVGAWQLGYAYGDHHSDRPMLFASKHPCAVNPDWTLARTARREGWTILNWG
ncbi:MAG: HAD family hydrolase [Raoultibacter sp.]